MEFIMKNILITGASGFIGRNVVEYLVSTDKYSLFFPSHSELELLDDEKVYEFIIKNRINIIVNCASVGGSRKKAYDAGKTDVVSKNLRIFFNLVRCLNEVDRIIHLGSGAEYDMRYYLPRMKEDYFDTHVPIDDYGFSKYVCSKYIMNSEKMVDLRLFGVFGKYEDYEYKFISNTIVKKLFGLPITINQNVYFNYLYINDLVRIIEYFINNKHLYKSYNVTTSETIDLLTIAEKINTIAEEQYKVIIRNSGLNTEYSGDNTRLLEELKGFNFTSFDDAINDLFSWYKTIIHKSDKEIIERDEYVKYCRIKLL